MGIPPMSDGVPEQVREANSHYGEPVYTSNGVQVGTFDQLIYGGDPGETKPYLLVTTGPLAGRFNSDSLYIPASAVENMGDNRVTLNVTDRTIGEEGWVSPPLGAGRW